MFIRRLDSTHCDSMLDRKVNEKSTRGWARCCTAICNSAFYEVLMYSKLSTVSNHLIVQPHVKQTRWPCRQYIYLKVKHWEWALRFLLARSHLDAIKIINWFNLWKTQFSRVFISFGNEIWNTQWVACSAQIFWWLWRFGGTLNYYNLQWNWRVEKNPMKPFYLSATVWVDV